MPSQLLPLSPPPLPHVVIFPFMAQGHTIPLLDLSKVLSNKSIKVTIITTPSNASFILPYISNHSHNIHLKEIPFPQVQDIPIGCENTSQLPSLDLFLPFLNATKNLQPSFHQILKEMALNGSLPICVISDFFLCWTLATCRSFDVPRVVFHGMGVSSLAISKTLWVQPPYKTITATSSNSDDDEEQPLSLPGLTLPFTLTYADLPQSYRAPDHNDPFSKFIADVEESDNDSWGVIVNSFVELEQCHVTALESFYKQDGAKAWCVGPLLLYNDQLERIDRTLSIDQCHTSKCVKWLTEQAKSASVIYVSFGTQVHVSDAQLDEIAFGLELSGHSYLWVVRSKTWTPPDGIQGTKGLIICDQLVDQLSILAHHGTGGFLSHCGWNSVLESLSMGVPILAWPMIAEQSLNAKLVVEGLGAAIRLAGLGPGGVPAALGREAICEGVKELMGGEKGRSVRERAQGFGRVAGKAVEEGGSSSKRLSELIDKLCALKKEKSNH